MARCLYNRENPIAPRIVAASKEGQDPLLVTRWLPVYTLPQDESSDRVVAAVAERSRLFKPITDSALLSTYRGSLSRVEANAAEDAFHEFDNIGVLLNAPMTNGFRGFQRTHPQVELMRLRHLLARHFWRLPVEFSCRVESLATLLLDRPFSRANPALAQADPKTSHYLLQEGEVVICDFEHSHYSVGPVDEAFWVATVCFSNLQRPTSRTALRRLRRMIPDDDLFYLGCCWLLADIVYRSLIGFASGNGTIMKKAHGFLADFSTQWLTV